MLPEARRRRVNRSRFGFGKQKVTYHLNRRVTVDCQLAGTHTVSLNDIGIARPERWPWLPSRASWADSSLRRRAGGRGL